MRVSLGQQRSSIQTVFNMSHRQLGLRESEADLLKEHLRATDALLAGHEAHPEITDALRKAMLADRGVVL